MKQQLGLSSGMGIPLSSPSGAEQLLWGCHTDGILSPVLPKQNAEAWAEWDEDKGVDLLGFQGQTLVFHRYYDHKRHAAKKTQKTVEAAEKVFSICLDFRRCLKGKSLQVLSGKF